MEEKFIKITEDIMEETEEDIFPLLVSEVKWNLVGNIADKEYCYKWAILNCESPVEQLLAIELERINIIDTIFYNPFVDVVAVDPQKDIECNGKTYRVDFFIPVVYKNQGAGKNENEYKMFVVECDGHEFHQKTKEQVERDNQRMRDLQMAGYEIIRFSGTELWHKSYHCAQEVLKIILSKCKYIKDK